MSKIGKRNKAILKELALKEGGKERWREVSSMRRNPERIRSSQTIVDKKHKGEKYPHAYKFDY